MWLHIIACLLALIGVVPAITMLSPVRVAHRAMPLIMIIASLFVWFLPTGIDVALALVPVAAWISARLGIEHADHEPVNVKPAVELARRGAQRARERVVRAKPVEVQEFVKPGDPGVLPADTGEPGVPAVDSDAGDEGEPAPTFADRLAEHVSDPRLPPGLRSQLGGQRAGRDSSVGIRNTTTTRVPQFVPAL